MTEILKSIGQGVIHIFGVDLVVHVLEDGQRVIEEQSLIDMFEAMGAAGTDVNESEINQLAEFMKGLSLPPAEEKGEEG